ncbi:hypothetical protein EB796_006701 [Bugula neritina]|uniref:Uncharacterized protein n=1 Tax=Bugula neritina TaxID=10212 RepID=A0A7J7K8N0_BUGNE|nr:hypothetical protein EB796_006701 [Bugula neritina]
MQVNILACRNAVKISWNLCIVPLCAATKILATFALSIRLVCNLYTLVWMLRSCPIWSANILSSFSGGFRT